MSLDNIIDSNNFNGIVSISQDRNVTWEKSYNYFGKEFDGRTKFFIGSITKQMVAVLIMRMVEDDLVDLYRPLVEYYPQLDRTSPHHTQVTLENLLTHTSGLIPSTESGPSIFYKFAADKQFQYANQGYHLLAEILTKFRKKSLSQLYQELFTECGMFDSSIVSPDTQISTLKLENLAPSHLYVPRLHSWILGSGLLTNPWTVPSGYSFVDYPFNQGPQYLYSEGGNVISTCRDLHQWNTRLYTGKVFKYHHTLAEFLRPRVPKVSIKMGPGEYCLGLEKHQDYLHYCHTGWVYGYQSSLFYFPDAKVSVVILENVSRIGGFSLPPTDMTIHRKIIDVIKGTLV